VINRKQSLDICL